MRSHYFPTTLTVMLCLCGGRISLSAVIPPNNPTLAFDASTRTSTSTAWTTHVNTTSLTRSWQVGGTNQPTHVSAFDWDTPGIMSAYSFSGSDTSLGKAPPSTDSGFFTEIPGDPTNNSASFEFWIKPAGLNNGLQLLFESGGSGDGLALMLEDGPTPSTANLRFQIRDSDTNGSTDIITVVKSGLTASHIGEFVQVVGVVDMDTDASGERVSLYVNGQLAGAVADTSSGFFQGNGTSFTQDRTGANPLDAWQTSAPAADLRDWDGGDMAYIGGKGGGTIGGTNTGGGSLDINSPGTFLGEIAIVNFFEEAFSAAQVAENYAAITQAQSADRPQFGRFSTSHTPETVDLAPYGDADDGKAIGFTTALTYVGVGDGVARNNFVNDGQLQTYFQEGRGGDGPHSSEEFGYLAVGPAAPDGEIRARDFGGLKSFSGTDSLTMSTNSTNDFVTVTFPEAFDEVPVVLADMLTKGGADPAYVRVFEVTTTGFKMQIDETEWDVNTTDWAHATERIGWFAVEQGTFEFTGMRGEAFVVARTTDDAVGAGHTQDSRFTTVNFLNPFTDEFSLVGNLYFAGQAVADMTDDVFASWRVKNLTNSGFRFAAENSLPFDDGLFASSAAPYFAYLAITIPEPASLVLLALGGIGLIGFRRRQHGRPVGR